RDAVILAHNYQVPEIQDVADYVGDSLGLSRQAAQTDASAVVLCGVHFMAETAAILSPEKTILIPDLDAGCSLAASADADPLRPSPPVEARAPRPPARPPRHPGGGGRARPRFFLPGGERQAPHRVSPRRSRDPLPARSVPRSLARARDRPEAAHLDGGVPRPRRHPAAGHRALAGGRARRGPPRPPRVRVREPGDGVRERADADPLDREDGVLRADEPEAALP